MADDTPVQTFIEQSIQTQLQSYAREPNAPATWAAVVAAIESFLQGLVQQGKLVSGSGAPFIVTCGLGTTMTPQEILDGYMIVSVQVQLAKGEGYTPLSFTQTMGS